MIVGAAVLAATLVASSVASASGSTPLTAEQQADIDSVRTLDFSKAEKVIANGGTGAARTDLLTSPPPTAINAGYAGAASRCQTTRITATA